MTHDPYSISFSIGNPFGTTAEKEQSAADEKKKEEERWASTPARLKLFFGQDAAKPPLHDDTVVEGLLHTGAITLMYGKPKSGKSFLATNLALAVADEACTRWMEHKIKKTGVVLYIACEGHGGFWKRLQAAGPVPDNFIVALGRPKLVRSADGKGYVWIPNSEDIRRAVHDVKKAYDGRAPLVVVIDTVFRSLGGADANRSADMNAYIEAVQEIADMGIAVLLVHHANKGNGLPSGSVVLMAAADTIVLVDRPDRDIPSLRTWEIEEAKDGAETPPREFQLFVVHDIENAEGDWLSSCRVIDKGGYTPPSREEKKAAKEAAKAAAKPEEPAKPKPRPRSEPTEIVWGAIVGLLANGGAKERIIVDGEGAMPSITREQIRDHLKKSGQFVCDDKGNLTQTERKWLSRGLASLRDRGEILVRDDLVAFKNGSASA